MGLKLMYWVILILSVQWIMIFCGEASEKNHKLKNIQKTEIPQKIERNQLLHISPESVETRDKTASAINIFWTFQRQVDLNHYFAKMMNELPQNQTHLNLLLQNLSLKDQKIIRPSLSLWFQNRKYWAYTARLNQTLVSFKKWPMAVLEVVSAEPLIVKINHEKKINIHPTDVFGSLQKIKLFAQHSPAFNSIPQNWLLGNWANAEEEFGSLGQYAHLGPAIMLYGSTASSLLYLKNPLGKKASEYLATPIHNSDQLGSLWESVQVQIQRWQNKTGALTSLRTVECKPNAVSGHFQIGDQVIPFEQTEKKLILSKKFEVALKTHSGPWNDDYPALIETLYNQKLLSQIKNLVSDETLTQEDCNYLIDQQLLKFDCSINVELSPTRFYQQKNWKIPLPLNGKSICEKGFDESFWFDAFKYFCHHYQWSGLQSQMSQCQGSRPCQSVRGENLIPELKQEKNLRLLNAEAMMNLNYHKQYFRNSNSLTSLVEVDPKSKTIVSNSEELRGFNGSVLEKYKQEYLEKYEKMVESQSQLQTFLIKKDQYQIQLAEINILANALKNCCNEAECKAQLYTYNVELKGSSGPSSSQTTDEQKKTTSDQDHQ